MLIVECNKKRPYFIGIKKNTKLSTHRKEPKIMLFLDRLLNYTNEPLGVINFGNPYKFSFKI